MSESRLGDPSKIISIRPKLYIKDDGTDYLTGEEFNGLWSYGPDGSPLGYASIGHWKFNELSGSVAFNNRVRGQTNMYLAGIQRARDEVGSYVKFKLPNSLPLITPSPYLYGMLGVGEGFVESTQFDQWLKSNPFRGIKGDPDSSKANMRYYWDAWIYAPTPPQNNGDIETLLYLHNTAHGSGDKILRFYIKNSSGTIVLGLAIADSVSGGTLSAVESSIAGSAIYPGGLSAEGGLHHIGLIYDRGYKANFGDDTRSDGFYVDGKYYAKTSGATTSWPSSKMDVDANAFFFCEVDGANPTFNATQSVGSPSFTNHFRGKIYSCSMTYHNVAGGVEVTRARVNTLFNLKFDIPRGPTKVDFSDRFEYKGRDLLTEISQIKQIVESDRGFFYVNLQTIKARN